jgi:hypothetical protein
MASVEVDDDDDDDELLQDDGDGCSGIGSSASKSINC